VKEKSPCENCEPPIRYPGCQCKCQIGLTYSRKVREKTERARAARNEEQSLAVYKFDRIADTKKKSHWPPPRKPLRI